MTVKTTLLAVPEDAIAHAKRFGAKYDPTTKQWFVTGDVPRELLNYLPRVANQQFHEPTPSCPQCGGAMRKIYRVDGSAFWGCLAYFRTGCRGLIDYVEYLEALAPLTTLGDFLPNEKGLKSVSEAQTPTLRSLQRKPPHHLTARWLAITQEALQLIGSERRATRWLEQPKLAFNNKSPTEMMGTDEGCDAVVRLLREIWR